jgi:hypothetical protein
VLPRQAHQFLQGGQIEYRTGGISRATQIKQLAALPVVFTDLTEVRQKTGFRAAVEEVWPGSRQQGGTFIDLVKGVGAHDQGLGAVVYHSLGEGEQGLTGAVDRQYLLSGVDAGQLETVAQPGGYGFAQLGHSRGGGIFGHPCEALSQHLQHKPGGSVSRLANGQ